MEKELYAKLSAALSKEAVQRSTGAKTGKGYDTTGYGYQYIVNRFNEVLGIGGWNWSFKEVERAEGAYRSGQKFYAISGEATITLFLEEGKSIAHTEYGGHQSASITDALKGASTNALKKTAAFFGVGKAAFEKTIDEDNANQPAIKSVTPIDWEKKLKAAKNLVELKAVYSSMPQQAKADLKGIKDLLKTEFEEYENSKIPK